jgi:hypothetical protein
LNLGIYPPRFLKSSTDCGNKRGDGLNSGGILAVL